MRNRHVELQVLIAAYGEAGLARVVAGQHPQVPGVEYLIGWQTPDVEDPDKVISRYREFASREDVRILPHADRGVSRNRNYLLDRATGPLAMLGDDDVDYKPGQLRRVIEAFREHPEYGFITFRYDTDSHRQKEYPGNSSFDLSHAPRFYYVGAIEMSFRVDAVQEAGVRFNEHFGFGTDDFLSGEDVVFMHSVLRRGIRGLHIPEIICRHRGGLSTCNRERSNPRFIESKGAIVAWMHPHTWPLRMLFEARRYTAMPAKAFVRAWLSGVRKGRRLKIWK